MINNSNRAKFSCVNYSDIQQYVNDGKINVHDIVYTKDTHENVFVGTDLSIHRVRSRIYRYLDVSDAEKQLNNSTDTYEGQLVAINSNGAYVAYIVNKNSKGSFYVTKLSDGSYDSLSNRPVDNLAGTLESPVIISELSTGIYKVKGQYKICGSDLTTYLSASEHIFLVNQDDSAVSIKKITASAISDYTVADDAIMSKSEVGTKEWVKEQGYATEKYVDAKIAALDYITQQDVEDYVAQVIATEIEPLIDKHINETFKEAERQDIDNMF